MAEKPKRKRTNTYGLYPKNYPKPIQWKIDQDYASKLSFDEREYLAKFNDAYYGNNFRGTTEEAWSPEQKRAAYRQNHAARRDTYEIAGVEHTEDIHWEPTAASDTDWSDTPSYLETPEYHAAIKAYRSAAEGDRTSPEYFRAKRTLEALIEEREESEE